MLVMKEMVVSRRMNAPGVYAMGLGFLKRRSDAGDEECSRGVRDGTWDFFEQE